MELIYGEAVALALGLLLSQVLPWRDRTGALLLPAVAGSACAIVWTALTWLGAPPGGGLLWSVSLGCAVLSAAGLGLVVRRRRVRAEEARLSGV